MSTFALHGHIIYTPDLNTLKVHENAWLICEEGRVVGIFDALPERYAQIKTYDYTNKLIVPGFIDLHTHAPQYPFRGIGMDLTLFDWLARYTFPEEAKYADEAYADAAYTDFVNDLKASVTTRAVIFATLHVDATLRLMQKLEASGLSCYVGKVSMDTSADDNYKESTKTYLSDLKRWLASTQDFINTKPILTPRFVPACSEQMLSDLGKLQAQMHLPVQSHLSETSEEVQYVHQLYPSSVSYGHVYDQFDLFGKYGKTVMAHCVYSSEDEIALMQERGVYIAHCPQSNMNLASGIAPITKYLRLGLPVGLGSDVAAGRSLSGFDMVMDAVGMSKLAWRLGVTDEVPLSMTQAFYLATKGGGTFFGKVGSFEAGYDFDACVIDDSALLKNYVQRTLPERLAQAMSERTSVQIVQKFVAGRKIF